MKIKLNDQGEITVQTTLTQNQVAKFNGLATKLMIVDKTAYLRLDELHGVLMTNSKKQAQEILMNHAHIVQHYLVYDPIKFAEFGVTSAVKPAGIYLLLLHLAEVNAKRAPEYRASITVLSAIIAQHPGVMLADKHKAVEQEQAVSAAMQSLKKKHKVCQLTGLAFSEGVEKHAHHIEGQSENPQAAADTKNMAVLAGWVHTDYHDWVLKQKLPVCKQSLGLYAIKRNHNGPLVQSWKAS